MHSPFYLSRREYEDKPLIWLPPDFWKMEDQKPIYIAGSRGTGKTFLLRALWWRERLENPHLQRSLGGEPFKDRFIGLYLRMPNYMSGNFAHWPARPSATPDENWREVQGQRFSLYLEVITLQLLCEAIEELRAQHVLSFSVAQEKVIVSKIILNRPELSDFMTHHDKAPTVSKLHQAFKKMQEEIRARALYGLDLDYEQFPALQIGHYFMEVGTQLLSLCDQAEDTIDSDDQRRWRARLCIDEAECLSPIQQKVLNTVVRVLEHPLSLVAAYVTRSCDTNSTFIPNLSLTDADRTLRDLDTEFENDRARFQEFAEGVAHLRLSFELELQGLSVPRIDVASILGSPSINQLIQYRLTRSESDWGKELIAAGTQLAKHPFFKRHDAIPEESAGVPRIYEAYLLSKHATTLDMSRVRQQDSQDFRKYNVAALLCICRELGRGDIPYAGVDQVLALSDNCIRDFLRQMSFIYDEADVGLQRFCSTKVPLDRQIQGLKAASFDKLQSIKSWVKLNPKKVQSLIHTVGTLIGRVQGDYLNSALSLGSGPECGKIQIECDATDAYHEVRTIVLEAAESGFATIIADNEKMLFFTIHRLFAPEFGFTYRKPYATLGVKAHDILEIIQAESDGERAKLVQEFLEDLRATPGRKVRRNRRHNPSQLMWNLEDPDPSDH